MHLSKLALTAELFRHSSGASHCNEQSQQETRSAGTSCWCQVLRQSNNWTQTSNQLTTGQSIKTWLGSFNRTRVTGFPEKNFSWTTRKKTEILPWPYLGQNFQQIQFLSPVLVCFSLSIGRKAPAPLLTQSNFMKCLLDRNRWGGNGRQDMVGLKSVGERAHVMKLTPEEITVFTQKSFGRKSPGPFNGASIFGDWLWMHCLVWMHKVHTSAYF